MTPADEPEIARCADMARKLASCDHVTVLLLSDNGSRMRRVFSSMPPVFPTYGSKPVPAGNWVQQIIERKKPALFAGAEAIRATFPDHELILANDIHTVLNVPLVSQSTLIGSLNCLYVSCPAPEDFKHLARDIQGAMSDALSQLFPR
ncbi:GAF domain-containing protein [Hoeflea poritis]|uniref:GAF domain-containing protein n=1 Tax=Hoeflea poritis TaxID=2993659 RepID=A0ABT4VRB5_9HYPH|nr:GAF domain-containing protein [Hoeflea poritis]MDA4847246.1 GAF domain-containing protein [Hoeflea poritis]